MTTLTKDITAKFAVAAVAVAMIFAAFAPSAQAQTTEDLQQMINDLLAQVAQLQAQIGGTTGGGSASDVCPYTWTRDLTMGSEGADVMKLQQFLNDTPDLRVAPAGSPGSAGMETMYYGPATAAAVSKMQVMFRAEVLTPNGLVNPTGYFGASSRAKANDLCVTPVTTPTPEEGDEDGMEDEDEDEDEGPMTLQGEGILDVFEWDDEETDLEEGDEDVAIGVATLEATDGDIEVARMTFKVAGNTATEDAWDVFESYSLWVDGDMVAEMDASDEDDYLNEDEGTFRFSNLDLFVEEDEEVEVYLGVSVQDGVDDLPESFDFSVENLRYFDADGVAVTEEDLGDLGDTINVDVEEAGADEELTLSDATNNPDSTDIIVDTDSDTDDVTIAIGELEAEDNDMELNSMIVRIDTSTTTTNVVDEVRIVIDGQEFEAESLGTENDELAANDTGTGLTEGRSEIANTAGDGNVLAIWYYFDIDGDVVIDEGDEMDFEVVVDFRDNDDGDRYPNGTTIEASVVNAVMNLWDVEGADDLDNDQLDGSLDGESHTLVAEGILVPADEVETDTDTIGDGTGQLGEFTISFDVTAVEGDFFIADVASETGTATTGVGYTLVTPSGAAAPTSLSATLDSTGDENSGVFEISEGQTETITLTVSVDPATGGQYRVRMDDVFYTANVNGVDDVVEYSTIPAQDYRTSFQTIQN